MAKDIDEGGPAFPPSVCLDDNDDVVEGSDGMSLRDWFAGMAMQGMIAGGQASSKGELGEGAYSIADAMIRARGDL